MFSLLSSLCWFVMVPPMWRRAFRVNNSFGWGDYVIVEVMNNAMMSCIVLGLSLKEIWCRCARRRFFGIVFPLSLNNNGYRMGKKTCMYKKKRIISDKSLYNRHSPQLHSLLSSTKPGLHSHRNQIPCCYKWVPIIQHQFFCMEHSRISKHSPISKNNRSFLWNYK